MKTRVAIIGLGEGGSTVYRVLQKFTANCEVIGVCDKNPHAPGKALTDADGVFFTNQWQRLLELDNLNVIINATADPLLRQEMAAVLSPEISIIEGEGARLLITSLEDKEKLLETKQLKSELSAILDSVEEAIEAADEQGIIKYVNPAFTRATGIPEPVRVGQNILQVSPQGALAQALVSQRKVTGYRTTVGGSDTEVVSNAAPIFVDGKLKGAVVVFQPVNDILKLMDELKKSTNIIENLYARLGQVTGSKYTFDDLIGRSKPFQSSLDIAKKAAKSSTTVLISGESGTGKELYAHAIHHASNRRGKPFIRVNCAAIPESLLESEFFGYEKGAFTGANKSKLGKIELANGGTLFLDEIGDMSLFLQAKLLRVLQDMEFERVGGNKTIKVDVRVMAATNRDLKVLVQTGKFREDLYYRLNVLEIHIPPLRQRPDDIPLLTRHLIQKFNRKLGKHVSGVSDEALQLLFTYNWPGNVRELENILERAMVVSDESEIGAKHISQYLGFAATHQNACVDVMPLEKMEQMMLKAALNRYGTSLEGKKRAARALNISLATLYNKLKKYEGVAT